jgi:hypothetical protein
LKTATYSTAEIYNIIDLLVTRGEEIAFSLPAFAHMHTNYAAARKAFGGLLYDSFEENA